MYIAFLLATGILIGAGFVLALQWPVIKKARLYDELMARYDKGFLELTKRKLAEQAQAGEVKFTVKPFSFPGEIAPIRELDEEYLKRLEPDSERLGGVSDLQELRRQWGERAQRLNDMSIEVRADR